MEVSLYEYLEHEMDLKISFAKKEIFVDEPTEEDKKYLDLKDYSHVVVVKSISIHSFIKRFGAVRK